MNSVIRNRYSAEAVAEDVEYSLRAWAVGKDTDSRNYFSHLSRGLNAARLGLERLASLPREVAEEIEPIIIFGSEPVTRYNLSNREYDMYTTSIRGSFEPESRIAIQSFREFPGGDPAENVFIGSYSEKVVLADLAQTIAVGGRIAIEAKVATEAVSKI